jgi:DNA-binding NarL/FixJ family response regulator
MTRPNIQIDSIVREMTEQEYEAYLSEQAEQEAIDAEEAARIASRESALAKLAALGLTEDEIATL